MAKSKSKSDVLALLGLKSDQFWLMKSEPDVFSIDDLKKNKTTLWEGVRNYQARNHMNSMKVGDAVLFYHSSCDPAGVAGIALISKTSQPDPTQFDKKSEYYEPRATKEKPVWYCTELKYVTHFLQFLTLEEIKKDAALKNMLVIKRGMRLSVQPVTQEEFTHIAAQGLRS